MNYTPEIYESLYAQLETMKRKAWADQLRIAVDAEFS